MTLWPSRTRRVASFEAARPNRASGGVNSPGGSPKRPGVKIALAAFLALRLVLFLGILLAPQALVRAPADAAGLQFEKPSVDVGDWSESDQGLTLETPSVNLGGQGSQGGQKKSSASSKPPEFRKDRLFGTVEFRSKLKNMPKWQRVLQAQGNRGIDDAFKAGNRQREAQAWQKLKERLAGADALTKAKEVNAFFNQWPYRTDKVVYGINDYWATPEEFIKNSGDCEDYAITKFYALRQLGLSPDNMRIVVLRDTIRDLDHAVLAVYIGEEIYILDNVSKVVLSHSNYRHYRPYHSLNEVYRWAHVPPSNQ